jgi:hypothetical protein
MAEDRTLPKVPAAVPLEPVVVKVTPRCAHCGLALEADLTADHHVCVPDGVGGLRATTASDARDEWKKAEDARAAVRLLEQAESVAEATAAKAALDAEQAAALAEIQAAHAKEMAALAAEHGNP